MAQISLDYAGNPNLQYTINNLGQIPTDQYNFLPQSPVFWFHCNEITAQQAGMTSRQATVYVLQNLEMAIQMVGVDIAKSSVPTILHPSIGDQAVELKEGNPDPVALWVRLMEQYPKFGPEKWMRRAFKFMLPLTASDSKFHLASMVEQIPVVQLLKDSADLREAEPYSRLQWMLFCFFGVDAMDPKQMLVHRIKMVEALRWVIADIKANGRRPAGFHYPSDIRVAPEAQLAETIQMILAFDLEYFKVDVRYCDRVKCCDVRSDHIHNWSEICNEMRDLLAFVPYNKIAFQYIAQIIITTLSGATYIFDLLDIAQDELKTGLEKKISDGPHTEMLRNMALRPHSQPWQDLLLLLTDASIKGSDASIDVGWGKENDAQVLYDTLGFEFVDKFEERVFMSNVPGNFQLQ